MHRPEGWKNPHKLNLDKPCLNKELPEAWNIEPAYSVFEAGADAMLEGLKKEAITESHYSDDYIAIDIGKSAGLKMGWLVFIPEEGE